jgi:hypothetical protein
LKYRSGIPQRYLSARTPEEKKSKASSDHPRKLAATTCFCSLAQPDNAAIAIRSASNEMKAANSHPADHWIVVQQ